MTRRAAIVGSGPNGLAAATVLAQSGLAVDVYEAQPVPGGAARTLELTLPGFRHDFGSAVHPMAAGSPFLSSLPLAQHGLEWIHSPAPLAHPFDDGTAIVLERNLDAAKDALGPDARAWRRLFAPIASRWSDFAPDVLRPLPSIPRHPFLLARFGLNALLPATTIARRFQSPRTRALLAGLAAHSFLSLDEPLSGAFGMILGAAAHAGGWPIPRAGSQAITNALLGYLSAFPFQLHTSSPIASLDVFSGYDLVLCDVTPRQLLKIGAPQLSASYARRLQSFRYGPAAFKVDYALNAPIPWKAAGCKRAATVHLGGTLEEIAGSEKAMRSGKHSDRPFVLLAQPSLFDPTRAPAGKHTAWAYCHIPNGSTQDMLEAIEAQIERFAPRFRETILARRVFDPAALELLDANLVGGDIAGGASDLRQFLFRPTARYYATSNGRVFLCSASTPPGGGVHGMCGYHAARRALRSLG